MSDYPLIKDGKVIGSISITNEYKPGDQPPNDYIDHQEWANVQMKAGLKQQRCSQCSLYCFPQEIYSVERRTTIAYRTKRDAMNEENPIEVVEDFITCNKCAKQKDTL